MSYQTQREKIKSFIDKNILQKMENKTLDYYKVIGIVAGEVGVSKRAVKDALKSYILTGKLVELRELSIPLGNEKSGDAFDNLIKKELKEAGL